MTDFYTLIYAGVNRSGFIQQKCHRTVDMNMSVIDVNRSGFMSEKEVNFVIILSINLRYNYNDLSSV